MTANMTTGEDDKDEANLYIMDDDKSDGEGIFMPTIIVEDEPGILALNPVNQPRNPIRRALEDNDEGSDDDKDDGDDDAIGWEDAIGKTRSNKRF